MLTKDQKHELLMKHKNHNLWNVPYNKWTDEDCQNLINGINKSEYVKPVGSKVAMQPVKTIQANGTEQTYKSVADCARKTGINENTIYAAINGRRRLKKVKFPLFEKVNP